MTQSPMEPEDQASSLVPVILSILGGIAAYSAGRQTVQTWEQVAEELRILPRSATALASVVSRALLRLMRRTNSPAIQNALTNSLERIRDKAVADGVQIISQAARALSEDLIEIRKAGDIWVDTVSLPGEHFEESGGVEHIKTALSPDRMRKTAEDLAKRTHQTLWNATEFYAAEEVGWPRKTWHSKKDTRVRATHAFLGSPKYEFHTVDIGQPFITIDGNALRYPGDPLAPIEETARCRCWLVCHR